MTISNAANVLRQWEWPPNCGPVGERSVDISTDIKSIQRLGRKVCCAWQGPITSRARLEVSNFYAPSYPNTLKLVLASASEPESHDWDVLTATVAIASIDDAIPAIPVGIATGFPTRYWVLFAWLDPASQSETARLLARLYLDCQGTGTPAIARATGVLP